MPRARADCRGLRAEEPGVGIREARAVQAIGLLSETEFYSWKTASAETLNARLIADKPRCAQFPQNWHHPLPTLRARKHSRLCLRSDVDAVDTVLALQRVQS
jgi:hypothetical protein